MKSCVKGATDGVTFSWDPWSVAGPDAEIYPAANWQMVKPALKVSLVPTAALVLTSVSLEAWRVSGATWMLASVGVGGTISLLAGCAGVVALPYVVSTGVGLRQGWLVAWYVTTRSPVPVVAVAAAVVLAVWVSAHLSFAMIMLLPAPVAVIWAAGVRQAIDHGAMRLAQ